MSKEKQIEDMSSLKKSRRVTIMKQKMNKCPHCGSDWGVYVNRDYVNVSYCMNWDGSEGYNGEMYDNAERIIQKKSIYCQECGKRICSAEEFYKMIGDN